jgi:hypothetical protein
MRSACLLVIACLLVSPAWAQIETDFDDHLVQVFLQRDIDSNGTDSLQFIDMLTGELAAVQVVGERYTVFGRSVMFFDPAMNRVRLAIADGRVRNHPFIQPLDTTRRLDWLVAGGQVAWTMTEVLANDQLRTRTTVANIDGSRPREVLADGPRPGIRAMPVAFSGDGRQLFMDYQPDGIADFTPFQQYAGLFTVDVDGGEPVMLPGEPGCFCGAGLGAGLLLRLELTDDLSGYDVVVHNLAAETSERIDALRLSNYTQAGDVIIAPDGTRAVYALAQVSDFGGAAQSVQTVFVLVNLREKTQTTLTSPITTFVQPIAWTEDDTAIIFTSADPNLDGTWKIHLDDGRLSKVADATLLGVMAD